MFSWRFLVSIVGLLMLLIGLGFVEEATPSSGLPKQKAVAHGLVLTIGLDQTPQPKDSGALRDCLGLYPPLVCERLTVLLKNEGKETILSFSTSCGHDAVQFKFLKPGGGWESFPMWQNGLPLCGRNVAILKIYRPGESEVRHMKLADDSSLDLDMIPRPDDKISRIRTGYDFLLAPGAHTIRAHWAIYGCASSHKLKPDADISYFTAGSLCAADTKSTTMLFARPQSNELQLSPDLLFPN